MNETVLPGLFVFLLAVMVGVAMLFFWHIPPDLYSYFYPTAGAWLSGQTALYDAFSAQYFHAPWMLGLLLPFADEPFAVTQFVWTVLTLCCVIAAVALFWDRQHFSSAVLAVAGLPILFVLNNGSADGILVLGLAFSYSGVVSRRPWWVSVGLAILLVKFFNVILVLLLIAWAVRNWQWREWLKILTIPLTAIVASACFAGIDWPLRYLKIGMAGSTFVSPLLRVTLWRANEALGLPLWLPFIVTGVCVLFLLWYVYRHGFNELTFCLAIATNLVITPYAMEQHYALLIPAYLLLARNVLLRWGIYATMFIALLRLVWDWQASWVMVLYPISILLALWGYAYWQTRRQAAVVRIQSIESAK